MTEEGITISFDLAAVLGSGRLRDLVERDARANGYALPTQVVAFLSECESVRRAVDAAAGTAGTADRYRPVESVSVTTYADLTGRDPRSVRRSCQRGTLPAWRDGRGAWRIDSEEMK